MTFKALTLGLSMALLLPGCLDDSFREKEEKPSNNEDQSGIFFTDCKAWSVGFRGAGVLLEERPPGWEDAALYNPPLLNYLFMNCQRISWGPFERGPIWLIWELHENFQAPPVCENMAPNGPLVVSTLVISDSEIAMHAAEEYGLPSLAGNVDFEQTGQAPTISETISITMDGSQPTSFSLQGHAIDPSSSHDDGSYFWDRGTGVGLMQWTADVQYYSPDPGTAQATINPPFQAPPASYAGTVNRMFDFEPQFDPIFFGDYECNED